MFNTFGLFYDKKYLNIPLFKQSFEGWKFIFKTFFHQKILGFNRNVPWPISPFSSVDEPLNIFFEPEDSPFFHHFGCYFSNAYGGKIYIGKGTKIAPNVGLITTNHDLKNPSKHQLPKNIVIGQNCWIGMGSILLPGVELGDNVVVAANSVVTKSFDQANLLIGGNPAVIIKKL
jgi:acetyltransferase-like isoleucine patch superfamily enzyme